MTNANNLLYTVLKGDYPNIEKHEHLTCIDVSEMLLECAKKDNWDISVLCEDYDVIPCKSTFGGYTITDGTISITTKNGSHAKRLDRVYELAPHFNNSEFQQIESWQMDANERLTENLLTQMINEEDDEDVEHYDIDCNTIDTEYHNFIIMDYNDMYDLYFSQVKEKVFSSK